MSDATPTLRTATSADAAVLCALVSELEGETFEPAAFAERLEAQLADARYTCLIAEDQGAVAGMLNLRIEHQLHHARPAAEILELVVAPGARSRGLGARLVERARALARTAGCEVFEVTSNVARADAHRFYERMGMRKTHYRLTQALVPPPGEDGR